MNYTPLQVKTSYSLLQSLNDIKNKKMISITFGKVVVFYEEE